MASSFVVVLTTLPSRLKARKISELLIKKKLAACVNMLGPAQSLFWWKGKVDRAKEYLLLMKTQTSRYPALKKFLEKNHSYSVPEIIALPIVKGNASYLDWIKAST